MALFKLKTTGANISEAELVEASHTTLELEQHLECWLEASPWAIAEEPLLVIGRQTSAAVETATIFPDLLALDAEANLVVVELKKGRAPREVVAQLLEYAAWAAELSQPQIEEIAARYFAHAATGSTKSLAETFCELFDAENLPPVNRSLRLFIAAEEIPNSVARVCRFLRTSHGVDINCAEFHVFQTESGEILVSSEWVVGHEDVGASKQAASTRWSGDKPVRQVVWEAVKELTNGDKTFVFSPKDVTPIILKSYPDFKQSNVRPQIISDCVNHTSRHHYPGGQDYYWWLEKGRYRLFNPEIDQVMNGELRGNT